MSIGVLRCEKWRSLLLACVKGSEGGGKIALDLRFRTVNQRMARTVAIPMEKEDGDLAIVKTLSYPRRLKTKRNTTNQITNKSRSNSVTVRITRLTQCV